jgi:hypothetical protein
MDQALPTQFDNTASAWEYNPMFAAMQMGQQNAIAENNNAALQRAYQGEQDFQAQKRPMDLLKLAADTGLTNAHTGYYNGLTDETGLKNQLARGTMDSSISAANSKNAVSQGNDFGILAGQVREDLRAMPENTPSWQKAQYVASKMGITNPDMVSHLISHADHLDEALSQINNEYHNRSAEGRKEFQSHMTSLEGIKMHTDSAEKIAGMQIDAGRFAGKSQNKAVDLLDQVKAGKLSYEKAAVAFQVLADMTDDKELANQYVAMARKMEAANIAAKNAQGGSKVDIGAIGEGKGIQSNTSPPSGIGEITKKSNAAPPSPSASAPAGALKYASPQGQDWVKRAMQANPGMSEADIITQGRQRGKLVD